MVGRRDLRNPDIVYQLSLRMGVSYEATCWGLLSHQILPRGEVDALRKVPVARLKSRLGGEFKPRNSWADVWRITGKDDGALARISHGSQIWRGVLVRVCVVVGVSRSGGGWAGLRA